MRGLGIKARPPLHGGGIVPTYHVTLTDDQYFEFIMSFSNIVILTYSIFNLRMFSVAVWLRPDGDVVLLIQAEIIFTPEESKCFLIQALITDECRNDRRSLVVQGLYAVLLQNISIVAQFVSSFVNLGCSFATFCQESHFTHLKYHFSKLWWKFPKCGRIGCHVASICRTILDPDVVQIRLHESRLLENVILEL